MRVAIIGATGAVGREMLSDLEDSKIKDIQIGFFASQRSAGEMLTFRGKSFEVKAYQLNELKGFDVCLGNGIGDL